tara:strand:- start:14288 stop:15007 length:720 start_codon:yes stop_codon:yes gene_type:complete
MQVLRRRLWWEYLKLDGCPTQLPSVTDAFVHSEAWELQKHTLNIDMSRMRNLGYEMNESNVYRTIVRYARCHPTFGYTQGNLYLLWATMQVFQEESHVFWAFVRMCDMVNVYGPTSPHLRFRRSTLPDWVMYGMEKHVPNIDRQWLEFAITLRWMFTMWGQVFSDKRHWCVCLDYILKGSAQMLCLAAAMLEEFYRISVKSDDPMEQLQNVFQIQIQSEEQIARIIAHAENHYPPSNDI